MPFTSRIFSHTRSLKLSLKMTTLRILLGLCCAFALVFSTVNCEDEDDFEMTNDDTVDVPLPDDDKRCEGFKKRIDEINGTCQIFNSSQFQDKNNISSEIIYKVVDSIGCSFCELKKDNFFSETFENCTAEENAKKRPYADTMLCGLEALGCTFEKLCDFCPRYFKQMNVTCKKESIM